jgi:hypothetical protein
VAYLIQELGQFEAPVVAPEEHERFLFDEVVHSEESVEER